MPEQSLQEKFFTLMQAGFAPRLGKDKAIAVGVSGGPDSMALCRLLSLWSEKYHGPAIHAVSIDHGLRPEAAQEAREAGERVKNWPKVRHVILKWEDAKPDSKIQEEARAARYRLIGEYCQKHSIRHVFLAHHQNDQAETFLFRLAKGSGLDGLAAMMPAQDYESLVLLRPLLDFSKDELVAFCKAEKISYAKDPSNENEVYARVRLRKARAALEEEGLSAKRLSVTARRLARARHALEEMAEMALQDIMLESDANRIVLNYEILKAWPGEIGLRVLMKAMDRLGLERDYPPRMEKIEELFEDLMLESSFRKRTLGGVVIERDDRQSRIVLVSEYKD